MIHDAEKQFQVLETLYSQEIIEDLQGNRGFLQIHPFIYFGMEAGCPCFLAILSLKTFS